MSSSASSSSLEPVVAKVSKKSKSKAKKTSVSLIAAQGKNEGVDPHWKYKPPAGATLLQNVEDAGEFDWDAVANDDDLELWLIRVPESVKPKYLENTTIEVPTAPKTTRAGSLKRKHATFDIWSVGEEDEHGVGGEEIKSLSCLLPRKSKKGKFYPAPKAIARHIVVSAQPVAPTPDPTSTGSIAPYARPPRESYPMEVLTHRFLPYGSLSGAKEANAVDQMDVDTPVTQPKPLSPTQKKPKLTKADSPEVVTKKTKGKKRKGNIGEVPPEKKQKKTKIL